MDIVKPGSFSLPSELADPISVLTHLRRVARDHNKQSFTLLQESLHFITHRVETEIPLEEPEERFLKAIYTCPWWGGMEYGLNEANYLLPPDADAAIELGVKPVSDPVQVSLAQMAKHFVDGNGQCYPLNLAVYRNASIVKDTVAALKSYIRELYTHSKPAVLVRTSDAGFLQSGHAMKVEARRKQADTMGFIFNDGTLMLDQKDPRLMTLGNRFRISAMTNPLGSNLMTRWRIEGTYRFENFAQGNAETGLPLNQEHVLTLPSCLGVYLAACGLAKPFDYFADWVEQYRLIEF